MQCACPQCAILMGHRIQGLDSECVCPECGFICKACIGTNSVLSPEEIRKYGVYHESEMGMDGEQDTIE